MPITKSAKKALRGSLKKKAMNDRNKKLVKESIKTIEKLVKEKKKDEERRLEEERRCGVNWGILTGGAVTGGGGRKGREGLKSCNSVGTIVCSKGTSEKSNSSSSAQPQSK